MLSFRILGPLEVYRDGAALPLGSAKQRALLALLLLNAGEAVSSGRLIDGLWGDEPPATADHLLHVYVSRLRKVLEQDGPELLLTRPPGYALRLRPDDELDSATFESIVHAARLPTTDPVDALEAFERALALWRGPVLADLIDEPFVTASAARLDELRVVAAEERIERLLVLGRHEDAVPELEVLVARYPLRERLRAQQMLALYRCGRQADALAAYGAARLLLAEELGVDPGPELRALEQDILQQAPGLVVPAIGPAPVADVAPEPLAARSSTRRLAAALAGIVVVVAAVAAVVVLGGRGPGGPTPRGDAGTELSWTEVPSADAFGGRGDQVVLGGADTRIGFLTLGYSAALRSGEATARDYDAAVWTAAAPEQWTRIASPSFEGPGNQRAADAAVLGGVVVIVGVDSSQGDLDAAVWLSDDDGATWMRVGVDSPALRVEGTQEAMRDVLVTDSGLVAVGYATSDEGDDAAVWTSPDGREWVALTQALGAPGDQQMAAVTRLDAGALAGGFTTGADLDAALWRSEAGIVWEPVGVDALGGPGDQQIHGLATGCGGVTAVGEETVEGETDAAVWRSTDGDAWVRVGDPEGVFGGPGPQRMFTIACSPNGLVAAGADGAGPATDGAVWTSPDGEHWARAPASTVTALADPAGRQSVRVLLPLTDGWIALGAEGRGADEDADAWIGRGT